MVERDVPPFHVVSGDRARVRALNRVGLRRRGVTGEALLALRRAHRMLFRSGTPLAEAVVATRAELGGVAEVARLLDFLDSAQRGVCAR
jgi:UDP-N-acetylglucosamine acyltransferase